MLSYSEPLVQLLIQICFCHPVHSCIVTFLEKVKFKDSWKSLGKSEYIIYRVAPRTEEARYMARMYKIKAVSGSELSEGYAFFLGNFFLS